MMMRLSIRSNKQTAEYFTFFQVRIAVNASKKGIVAMREKLQTILKIFRDANETLVFTPYKTDTILSESNLYTCAEKNTLQNQDH